jgi:hypothetical protein
MRSRRPSATGAATFRGLRTGELAVGLTLTLAFLAFASPASAAVRYASPGASGAEPCNPTPCTLQKAVNGAGDGDEVVVGAGTYKPTVEVEVDHAISVGGAPGAALPVVQISNHFLHEDNAAALVHDLRIEVVASTMPYAITDEAGSVERVYAYSFQSAGACEIASGTLRDSVCWGGLYASGFGAGNVHIVLRNVTATSTVMGAGGGANVTIDGANLIMHSIDPAQSNGADLAVDVSAGASASISLTHSNYASVDAAASSGTTFSYTPPGTNGNQTAPPLFVDAAAGNLHELAGSPTIDAGIVDPMIGATDLEGAARSQPPCLGGAATPDIGAYEFAPTTACPKPAIQRPSNLFHFVKLKRNKKKGTATLAILVPGPGTLTLSGKGLAKQQAGPHGVETVKLAVNAKGKAKKKLSRSGTAKVELTVTFTPTGGDPRTQAKSVKLIRRG